MKGGLCEGGLCKGISVKGDRDAPVLSSSGSH